MRFEIISDARWLKRIIATGEEQLWYLDMYWGQLHSPGSYIKGYAVPNTLALLKGAHT